MGARTPPFGGDKRMRKVVFGFKGGLEIFSTTRRPLSPRASLTNTERTSPLEPGPGRSWRQPLWPRSSLSSRRSTANWARKHRLRGVDGERYSACCRPVKGHACSVAREASGKERNLDEMRLHSVILIQQK